jgi:hypothetical protein
MKLTNLLFFSIFFYSLNCFCQFGPQVIFDEATVANRSITTADFDGDGDLDILNSTWNDFEVVVWYENVDGLGDFSTKHIVSTQLNSSNSCAPVDLDQDGDMDIVGTSAGGNRLVWFRNLDGLGTFSNEILLHQGERAYYVETPDVDGDGDPDIVLASDVQSRVSWFANNGDGTFTSQQIISNSVGTVRQIDVGDIDGDGDIDIVAAATSDDQVIWFENIDGEGNFGTKNVITSEVDGVDSVFLADLNGDQSLDILSTSFGDDKVMYFFNTDGSGNFDTGHLLTNALRRPPSVIAKDMDNDGDNDLLAIARFDDDRVVYFENMDGQGTFSEEILISNNIANGRFVNTGDVDNDGDQDIIYGSYSEPRFIDLHKNLNDLGVAASQEPNYTIHPNPTTGLLHIKSASIIQDIEVFTILGVSLKTWQQTNEIDISLLAAGTYMIRLQDVFNNVSFKRVVKF